MRSFKITHDDRHNVKRETVIKCDNRYRLLKLLYKQVGFKCYVYRIDELETVEA